MKTSLQLLDAVTRPDFHIFLHNLLCLYLGSASENEVNGIVVRCLLKVGEIQIYKHREYCRREDQVFCSSSWV